MNIPNDLLQQALTLKPSERIALIDKLLASLYIPDKEIDALWGQEVESRIDAYEQGQLKAVTLDKVLEKYK